MVKSKPKTSLLPVLVVLFLISYGLLTLLVVEQNRTITSQRNLIGQLYSDSMQLTVMKNKEIQKERAAQGKTQSPVQAPSSQANSQPKVQADSGRAHRQLLQKPKGVQDNPDIRRDLNKI